MSYDEKILGRKNPNEPGGIYPAEKDWGEKIITRTLRFLIHTYSTKPWKRRKRTHNQRGP